MHLLSASMRDFRNLTQIHLAPGPRATVLVGPNGQGKTNTLEALYYAAALRPLRGSRLSELIRFDKRDVKSAPRGACLVGHENSLFALAQANERSKSTARRSHRSMTISGKRPSLPLRRMTWFW